MTVGKVKSLFFHVVLSFCSSFCKPSENCVCRKMTKYPALHTKSISGHCQMSSRVFLVRLLRGFIFAPEGPSCQCHHFCKIYFLRQSSRKIKVVCETRKPGAVIYSRGGGSKILSLMTLTRHKEQS